MKVGIYKQHFGDLHFNFLRKYEKILNYNKIDCIWLEASQREFWQNVSDLDLFIYQCEHWDRPKQIAKTIIPIIQYEMKIPCFPSWDTSWHFDDKIKQYYLLKQHGFPSTESYIFWEKEPALNWLKRTEMPKVFKLKGGAGSGNVMLVKNKDDARKLISKMFSRGMKSDRINYKNSLFRNSFKSFSGIKRLVGYYIKQKIGIYEPFFWQIDKNYVLFQKFLPNNSFDTRVTIIGERAFAFRRMNRKNDFRASGSGIIDYDIKKIDPRIIEIAFKISKELKFQSMAYDFLLNENKNPEICEISYTYIDTAVYNCPGHWDIDLNWRDGHFWPQFCILSDSLDLPNLKQPE